MNKYHFLLLLLFCSSIARAQNAHPDFQSFRNSIKNDYQGFRSTIIDDYAKYLEGIWKDFQVFKGFKKDETPKPSVIPTVKDSPVSPAPHELPIPDVSPDVPDSDPRKTPVSPTPQDIPSPNVKPITTPTKTPEVPKPIVSQTVRFLFYGKSLYAAKMDTHRVLSMEPKDIAETWGKYQEFGHSEVLTSLRNLVHGLGLNDWHAIELIRAYSDEILKNGTSTDRIVLQHYLITNYGFDVRIAKNDKQLTLLIPFKQKMYNRSYLNINGVCYYIFYDNLLTTEYSSNYFSSCDIPDNIDKGQFVDLVYNTRSMSFSNGNNKKRTLTDGNLYVTCSVNIGAMELLRHYPQMDIPYYAASNVIPPIHQEILNQLRPQVMNMDKRTAANALLHFVQYAFEYATDGEQHGYEKAYFIEENFYYSKNDCEDRSIFYAFLVRNLLNLNVHLVQFPGHECTAINFPDNSTNGDGYIYNGKKYTICDPTYIGASIGQCMPTYRNTSPKIEEWY